jgi:predicted phosphodiesterase
MQVAIVTDVHGNRPAFEAVIAAAESHSVDEMWCLGDLVGYGAEPDACVALAEQNCTICLAGNHDLGVIGVLSLDDFSRGARIAAEWTRDTIRAETKEFLLALSPEGTSEGYGLFHASPRDPIWEYVLSIDQAEAGLDAQTERVCLIGHSHVALFFTRPPSTTGRRTYAGGAQATDGDLLDLAEGEWLLNPGSVGQPRDGDPRAAWLEIDTDEWTARYHRVPYDSVAAGAAILEAGLPLALAERLQVGR